MPRPRPTARAVKFGSYRLDLRSRELERSGRVTRLPEKPFLVLQALVEAPREVVTRAALRERLWPEGTFVDFDNNLNSAVASLRVVLRDSARRPRYIETLPRVGYRFVAAVTAESKAPEPAKPAATPSSGMPVEAPAHVRRFHPAALAALVGFVALAAAALHVAPGPATPRGGAAARIATAAPDDPAARRAYLHGRYLADRDGADNLALALESLNRAARLAPGFAPAEAQRAEVLSRLAFTPGRTLETDLAEARAAAQRALALDEALPAAHRVLAVAALHLEWDWAAAQHELRRALELDPLDDHSHLAAATLLSAAGRHDEAIREAERAVELDPSSNLVRADLGYFYLAAGRYEDSIRASREALELEPGFVPALSFLVQANERLGRTAQAAVAASAILERDAPSGAGVLSPTVAAPAAVLDDYHRRNLRRAEAAYAADRRSALWLALAHAEMDHRADALRYLGEAFEARDGWLVFAAGFPQFHRLRGDPEFDHLLGRLGFPRGGEGTGSDPSVS